MINDRLVEAFELLAESVEKISDQQNGPCPEDLLSSIRDIAHAITPLTAAPGRDESGGYVASLTEAVMSVSAALHSVADAINLHG